MPQRDQGRHPLLCVPPIRLGCPWQREPSFRLGSGFAKSLQSCPTLCDPIDSSPPGSPVPGILQARTLSGLPFPSPMRPSGRNRGLPLRRHRLHVESSEPERLGAGVCELKWPGENARSWGALGEARPGQSSLSAGAPAHSVFLPGESQGRGSLVGCCLWSRTESDTTEAT